MGHTRYQGRKNCKQADLSREQPQLIGALSDRTPLIPYKISRKKTSKEAWDGLTAED